MSTQDTKSTGRAEDSALSITVNGRPVGGTNGQSIAGVLLANGEKVLSRSVKYHRPRGYTCGFGMCGNCSITINGLPSTPACRTPASNGDSVELRQGFPSTRFDLLRGADALKPLLPAGFQFRLFAKQPRLSALAGSIMAVLAGGGRMPTEAAAARSRIREVVRSTTEFLVIGGGISGLSAGIALAELGAEVTIVDADFTGGRSLVRTEPIATGGSPVADTPAVYRRLLERAQSLPHLRLVAGHAAGLLDGIVPVVSGQRREDILPQRLVLATGSYEVPSLFAGNDRPGVMFADAAVRLREAEGVVPGKRVVIATDSSRGHDVAVRLSSAGVNVTAVVDHRTEAEAHRDAEVPRGSWTQHWGLHPEKVHGLAGVRSITFGSSDNRIRVPADTLVLAGRRRPTDEFALQLAYWRSGTHDAIASDAPEVPALRVGTADGQYSYDLLDIRQQAREWFRSAAPGPDEQCPGADPDSSERDR